jgi:hypothetical protein
VLDVRGIYVSLGHDSLCLGWLEWLGLRAVSHGLFTIAEGIPDIALELVGLLLVTDVFIEFDVR